jgi:hypothetical protein
MHKRTCAAIAVTIVAILLAGLCVSVASAGGSVDALITDASDGVVDGSYSVSTVREALRAVRSDPVYSQYSDVEGVLMDYLATLTKGSATPTPTPRPTATKKSTPTPTPTATPTLKASLRPTPNYKDSPGATPTNQAGDTPEASASAIAAAASQGPGSTGGAWERMRVRLGAVPWFFGVAVCVVVAGAVLLRRRRRVA